MSTQACGFLLKPRERFHHPKHFGARGDVRSVYPCGPGHGVRPSTQTRIKIRYRPDPHALEVANVRRETSRNVVPRLLCLPSDARGAVRCTRERHEQRSRPAASAANSRTEPIAVQARRRTDDTADSVRDPFPATFRSQQRLKWLFDETGASVHC